MIVKMHAIFFSFVASNTLQKIYTSNYANESTYYIILYYIPFILLCLYNSNVNGISVVTLILGVRTNIRTV